MAGFVLLPLVYVSLTSGVRVSNKLYLRSSTEEDSFLPEIGKHRAVHPGDPDMVTHRAAGDSVSHVARAQGGADKNGHSELKVDAQTRIFFEI